MNIKTKLLIATAFVALSALPAYAAKEVQINSNDTAYSEADVQKLAAIALSGGAKEPVNLKAAAGTVLVSGSDNVNCTFKVGSGATLQIQSFSCNK